MLIKNIETKLKLALSISIGSFICAIILVFLILSFSFKLVNEERQKVYVIDNGLPILVQRSDIEENEEVEMKSHVNIFHSLFFTLPPDDEFIKNNISKAMYLVDESGLKQYNNLREQGYYNTIMANSMSLSIKADSIKLDLSQEKTKFTYYATQRIERETSVLKRKLITEGYLSRIKRTENNPHGLIINQWKTLLNEDTEIKAKKVF